MKIGVFCSANDNIDSEYFKATEELGKWMGENGHTLVYGGCDNGLMKTIGDSVHNAGGQVIGVVPDLIEKGGKTAPVLDVHIPVDSLSARKDIMMIHSDVFIALPGGVGTLDEIFTVVASHTIGYHKKKVILYNTNGFWNSAIAMLNDMQKRNMIRGDYHEFIKSVKNIEELKNDI